MSHAQYLQTTATAANNSSSQPHVVIPPIGCLVIVIPMLLGLAIVGYQQYRATVLRWRIEQLGETVVAQLAAMLRVAGKYGCVGKTD